MNKEIKINEIADAAVTAVEFLPKLQKFGQENGLDNAQMFMVCAIFVSLNNIRVGREYGEGAAATQQKLLGRIDEIRRLYPESVIG